MDCDSDDAHLCATREVVQLGMVSWLDNHGKKGQAHLVLNNTEHCTCVMEGVDQDVLDTLLPVLTAFLKLCNAIASGCHSLLFSHVLPVF